MDMRIVNNIIRVMRSCFFSWALYLLFIFFEGVVFQKGSKDPHPWFVHGENSLYVAIPFLMFFVAILLFPLPKSRPYLWAVVRSIFMTAGIILCVAIVTFDYHPDYFPLRGNLIILSIALFGGLLLGSSCFWGLPCEENNPEETESSKFNR